MKRPGKLIKYVLGHLLKKPNTLDYPHVRSGMPKGFRGDIKFKPELCVGCKMCVKDCPSNAIEIEKIADKQFRAKIDLGKCIYCSQCVDSCFKKALAFSEGFELAQLDREKLKVTYDAGTEERVKE